MSTLAGSYFCHFANLNDEVLCDSLRLGNKAPVVKALVSRTLPGN